MNFHINKEDYVFCQFFDDKVYMILADHFFNFFENPENIKFEYNIYGMVFEGQNLSDRNSVLFSGLPGPVLDLLKATYKEERYKNLTYESSIPEENTIIKLSR